MNGAIHGSVYSRPVILGHAPEPLKMNVYVHAGNRFFLIFSHVQFKINKFQTEIQLCISVSNFNFCCVWRHLVMTLFAQTVNHVLFHVASDTGLSQVLPLCTIIYAHQMAVSPHLLVMFLKTLKA